MRSAAPSPATMSSSLRPPEPTCGEIVIEPVRQRGVEIDDIAVAFDREEAGRRVVEIVDGVLQFLEDVLLPLELARDVGERPHREALLALAVAERAHAHAQPPRRLARACGRRPAPPPAAGGLRAPP